MNKIRLTYTSLLGLTLLSANLHAIGLQQVYSLAQKSDPQLLAAAANYQGSTENVIQAKAALLPSIDAQLNAQLEDSQNTEHANSQGYNLSLNQPIYSPALKAGVNRVNIADTIAQLTYQQSEQQLILRTVQAYIQAMTAKSNLTTSAAQERAIKRRLDQAKAEFEVGVIAITDVHEAQASFDNAKVQRIISEGQLENSYQALQRLSGQAITNVDTLSETFPITPLQPQSAVHWVDLATKRNLNVQMTKHTVAQSQQDTDIAKANRGASVELQASHSGSEHSESGWNRDSKLAFVLSVPLYRGGALNSKVRQSLNATEAAQQHFQDALRATSQITRQIVRDIETNGLAIKARQQSIVSSQAALDAVSEGFKVGTRNIVDVLQAENALFSAQNNYATARLERLQLSFDLKYEMGTLNAQDISDASRWLKAKH